MANTDPKRVTTATSNTVEETPNLHTFLTANKSLKNREYIPLFSKFINYLKGQHIYTYCRKVLTPQSREVTIWDANTAENRKMIMFASNNYLGMANSPYMKKKVTEAMDKYGAGLAGPPLLNGYTSLMSELEERLARLKHQEAAMIFSSGYGANLGMLVALAQEKDDVTTKVILL